MMGPGLPSTLRLGACIGLALVCAGSVSAQQAGNAADKTEYVIDSVAVGNLVDEGNHSMFDQGSSIVDELNHAGRVVDGLGWFEYRLKVVKDLPQVLAITLQGQGNETSNFDVRVDEQFTSLPFHFTRLPHQVYVAYYRLPEGTAHTLDYVHVKFTAHHDQIAGPIFSCRILVDDNTAVGKDYIARELGSANTAPTSRLPAPGARPHLVDSVTAGDSNSEGAHHFAGNLTLASKPPQGISSRTAHDGGGFSYQLKVRAGVRLKLGCIVQGGGGAFDILVDDIKIASHEAIKTDSDQPVSAFYPIEPGLVTGKEFVTIRIKSHPGAVAGPVLELVMLEDSWAPAGQESAASSREQARERALEARSVDVVKPGSADSERDHKQQGESSMTGEIQGRMFRAADHGGWFSYDVKVPTDAPTRLMCQYSGSDASGREFDILVNGIKIATQVLENNKPGTFFMVVYSVSLDQTGGRDHVTVMFKAHPDKTAGGLFAMYVTGGR